MFSSRRVQVQHFLLVIPLLLSCHVTALGHVHSGVHRYQQQGSQASGNKCSADSRSPVHLPDSCFSEQEVALVRNDLLEMVEDNQDVQLVFFYLNMNVSGEIFYPGLCCWNHDQSADGITPLAWAWWRDTSGKAYLDMSLQHVDMWMLPLVTMQRNVHVISNTTFSVNAECWQRRKWSHRLRDLVGLLRVLTHAIDGDTEDSGLCWREQIAPFHPLHTLLWGALSPWGVNVVQYHIISTDGKDSLLEPLWTIQWMTVTLRCMLYMLALFIPLPILSVWQHAHDRAVAESMNVCLQQEKLLEQSRTDRLQLGVAAHATIRSMLNPHNLPSSCTLFPRRLLQSTRLWFCWIVVSVLCWQLACIWWTSLPGSIDLCERCLPAAKHRLLIVLLLPICTYVWLHLPSRTIATAPAVQQKCSQELSRKRNDVQEGTVEPMPHKYRITLRTLSLNTTPIDSFLDCNTDLGAAQHGAQSFISALYDALLLFVGVLTLPQKQAKPDQPPCRGRLVNFFRLIWKCVYGALHMLSLPRVSPLFLLVSMFLQRNKYVSFARHHSTSPAWCWLYRVINICVFALMWCLAVWLLHDLFHVMAYAVVGLVINAKLFVPWLVLLVSLVYQVKVAREELHQPFVSIKATVLEEYIKSVPPEHLCTRVVDHLYTTLTLRLVNMVMAAFEDCYWEARALQSIRHYTDDPHQQLHVVYRARFVKVLAKWLLFACAVQLLVLLLSSVYGFETLPAYMQLLAGVAPLGLTWMVSLSNHNPQLMVRLQQMSHAQAVWKSISRHRVCSCVSDKHSPISESPEREPNGSVQENCPL